MKVRYWYSKKTDFTSEKQAQDSLEKYIKSQGIDNISVGYNFTIKGSEYDCVIVSKSGFIIIDFKNFTSNFDGGENGYWNFFKNEIESGRYKHGNPFNQMLIQRSKFSDKLVEILRRKKPEISRNIKASILVSNRVNYGEDIKQLIKDNRWFNVLFDNSEIFDYDFGRGSHLLEDTDLIFKRLNLIPVVEKENEEIKYSISGEQNDSEKLINFPSKESLLVQALAGCGKTFFIIERIKQLVKNEKVDPRKILVLTFTKYSSKDINKKIDSKLYHFIGTFHSYCNKLLHENWKVLGFNKKPELLDPEEIEGVYNKALKPLKNSVSFKEIEYLLGKNEDFVTVLSENKKIEINNKPYYSSHLINSIMEVRDYFIKENIVDFTFLQQFVSDAIGEGIIKINIDYLFIDEYQDTSGQQFAFIQRIIKKNNPKIALVGDKYQSIYSWRGGRNNLFEDTKEKYPFLNKKQLNTNRRSTIQVINAINDFMKSNFPSENLNIEGDSVEQGSFSKIESKNELEEAIKISNEIDKLIKKDGIQPKDIAVLSRSNLEEYSVYIKKTLEANNIPIQSIENKLIKTVLGKEFLDYLKENKDRPITPVELFEEFDGSRFVTFKEEINKTQYIERLGQIQELCNKSNTLTLEELKKSLIEEYAHNLTPNGIVFTTIHSSKGLEWKYVFIIGLFEGVFPSHIGENIKEEQNLMYVAMTRAEIGLYLSICHRYRLHQKKTSSFLSFVE